MKKRKILWLLLLMLAFPKRMLALTGNLNISCSPNVAYANDTITCSVTGTTSEEIYGISANIDISSNLEFVSFVAMNGWEGSSSDANENSIAIYGLTALKDNFTAGTLTLKVKNGAPAGVETIGLSRVNFSTDSDNDATGASTTITIKKNTNLSNIIASSGTFKNAIVYNEVNTFNQLELNSTYFSLELYSADINLQDKIVVKDESGNTIDPTAITFDGKDGKMILYITVDGDTGNEYIIECTMGNVSYDNSLSSLVVGGISVELTDKDEYEVTLGKSAEYFDVEATIKDTDNFMFGDDTIFEKNHYFNDDGSTILAIEVVPKNSSSGYESKVYTLIVSKVSSGSTPPVTPPPVTPGTNSGGNTNTNPKTSTAVEIVVAVILIAAFGVSMVLYKKNMEGYE